jgi:hypothetical protein
MSMYLLPKTTIEKLDMKRKNFVWQGGGDMKKYHLVNWPRACVEKINGGLGIKSPRSLNISLLCKWWWKLENEKRGLAGNHEKEILSEEKYS